jgi:transcriptional regulator with XRE-family HTH domain
MDLSQFKEYQTRTNDDGTIDVLGVEIFELGQHKGFDYDETWAQKTLDTHQQLAYKNGYLPSIIIGHNNGDEEKPAKGRMANFALDGSYITCDYNRVPPEMYESLKKGEYPHRSVEVIPGEHRFTALALLGGTSPHHKLPNLEVFGEEPDAVPVLFDLDRFVEDKKGTAGDGTGGDSRRLIRALMDAGLTQDEIGAATNRSGNTIGQIFRGEIKNPPAGLVENLEELLKKNKGKKKKNFGDVDLETQIDVDSKLSKFWKFWSHMMDAVSRIIHDSDRSDDDKKMEIKDVLQQGTDMLKKESENFQEDKDMSEQAVQLNDAQLEQQFKEKYGYDPNDGKAAFEERDKLKTERDEFAEKLKKNAADARESSIKLFCDRLKEQKYLTPAIVDEVIEPLMQQLPADAEVKFSEKEDPQSLLTVFENTVSKIVEAAEKDDLFVPYGERTAHSEGNGNGVPNIAFSDKVDPMENRQKLVDAADKLMADAAKNGKTMKFDEALAFVTKNQKVKL